ncbi:GMC family oxidoreductase [Marinovum sp.]|uniref:GMC family oxidoreductase n=1 Tax=Marinovum sp. TaxID=2024839 RepID=UPI002B26DB51|nr:GMC family oxidoreductase [Marinovum sp.]
MTAPVPQTVDVLVVGAGMAGAHLALELAQAGRQVTVLEAGPRKPRHDWMSVFANNPVKGPQAPYPSNPWAPHPQDGGYASFYDQAGPMEFVGAYLRIYGGSTWHWMGFADRLRPADFRMKSSYGVARDWPVSYGELEDHYARAETIWGVAGSMAHTWGAPRKEPFPMPPVPASYLDSRVDIALKQMGLHSGIFSHARNSVQFDGRPACCGNNTCVPICPIGAKLDGSVIADKAEAAGAQIITEAVVTRINLGAEGRVTGVDVRRPDGSQTRVTANVYALCCHAIENPRLLLMSAQEAAPNGVANGSGAVGRYLITQANQDTKGVTRDPVYPYRGPQQTSGLVELRDGAFRASHAAIGTSFMNSGHSGNSDGTDVARQLIAKGLMGQALVSELNRIVSRHLRLNSSAEILPDADNRLTLSTETDSAGLPKPRIAYCLDEYTRAGMEISRKINTEVLERLGATEVSSNAVYLSNAIIGGTARMGDDPRTSVVNSHQQSHQHPNLYVMGSSAHVTMPVNAPTLTIAALAMRTAAHILG